MGRFSEAEDNPIMGEIDDLNRPDAACAELEGCANRPRWERDTGPGWIDRTSDKMRTTSYPYRIRANSG